MNATRHWSKLLTIVALHKEYKERPKRKANRQQRCSVGTKQGEGHVLEQGCLSECLIPTYGQQRHPVVKAEYYHEVKTFKARYIIHIISLNIFIQYYTSKIKCSHVTKRHLNCVVLMRWCPYSDKSSTSSSLGWKMIIPQHRMAMNLIPTLGGIS